MAKHFPAVLAITVAGLGPWAIKHFPPKQSLRFKFERKIKSPPRSKITGRFRQESNENRWNVEAIFSPEICRIFSDDFRPVPVGKHRNLTGIHRKKSKKIPVGILLPLPAIFGAFLQDPVAVIFDLGGWWIPTNISYP